MHRDFVASPSEFLGIVSGARRALVLGIGGGGDVVGALSLARLCEELGTPFTLGGVAWERIAVDPVPGPRPLAEIRGGRPLGRAAALADASTSTPEGVPFSEAQVAGHLGTETVLIDVTGGAGGAAAGIAEAAEALGCDVVLGVDVGGDALGRGDEPGLASPLCDAMMIAALVAAAPTVRPLLAVLGPGCDGELSVAEVLGRVAVGARAGAWRGAWGVTPAIADEVEALARGSHTEASLQVARCAHGEVGTVPIREGRRSVELGPVGALAFFFDPLAALDELTPLANVVAGSETIGEARGALQRAGVHSELDYERARARE